jgi:hypothetical protein
LNSEKTWKIWIFNLLFFHIFHIFSQFSSVFSLSFHYFSSILFLSLIRKKSRLNSEMIWKIWQKGKSNSD